MTTPPAVVDIPESPRLLTLPHLAAVVVDERCEGCQHRSVFRTGYCGTCWNHGAAPVDPWTVDAAWLALHQDARADELDGTR